MQMQTYQNRIRKTTHPVPRGSEPCQDQNMQHGLLSSTTIGNSYASHDNSLPAGCVKRQLFRPTKGFNADPSPTSSAALAMVVRFATCLVGAALWTQGVRKGLRHTQNRFLTHIRGEGLLHINQDSCIYNMHMYYILLLLLIIIIIIIYYY